MKMFKSIITAVFLLLTVASYSQTPTVFKLKPIPLSNGWRVTGTITTDGTVGALAATNIVDWNLKVVQTTDFVWTEKDSDALNISAVTSTGKKILVATSPDEYQDGGALYFSKPGGGFGTIGTNAVIADFTQLSTNLGFLGGIAGWQDEIWGLNYVGLNQRNNTQYPAASAVAGRLNVFRVNVPTISTAPLLMTMFGTITTDGTIGPLLPQNLVAWNVTARNLDIRYYTKANSTILSAMGVTSDGTLIKVDHAGGQFTIGISGPRPTFVAIADFTDPTYPNGYASYYTGNFGVMGDKFPLIGTRVKTYTVAKRVP
jgi:hypothetical protein